MTTEKLQPWNAALHRLLDVLAASAQPFIQNRTIYYRWGQHIYDDIGDNTGQYGVHGTSEATRAMAVSLARLGRNTRYQRFLMGGVACLAAWVEKPKKMLDFSKTAKVGEWLGALAEGGGDKIKVDHLATSLLVGRDPNSGAWDWNPLTPIDEPLVIPTLYALDGLTRVYRKYGDYGEEVKLAIQFCLEELRDETQRGAQDREASLSWQTALYKLCEVVSIYENAQRSTSVFRAPLEQLLRADTTGPPAVLDSKRFEYRIQSAAKEQHAFCVLPAGLMRLQTELWAESLGLKVGLDLGRDKGRLSDFTQRIYTRRGFPLRNVGSCSYAARMFAMFGEEIDRLVGDSSPPPRPNGKLAINKTPVPPAPLKTPDPCDERTAREALYNEILKPEGVEKSKDP